MNTTLLRYAVEYAACGSSQKTAERLGVNRSSVTRNIKRLEEELGTQLFLVTADGTVPTYSGDICLRYAREILKVEEDLRFDMVGEGMYNGTINIGMGASRAQQILPQVLPEFHRRYPSISVQLHEMSTADISIALLNRRLDFAVVGHPFAGEGFSFEPLLRERLVLVAPKDDAYAASCCQTIQGKPCVQLESFRDKPFVLGYPDQKSRRVCDRLFQELGYDPQIVFQTRNNRTAAMLAYNGLGYALVLENCTQSEPEAINYYYLESELDNGWPIGIVALGEDSLSHAAAQLKKLMIDILADRSSESE